MNKNVLIHYLSHRLHTAYRQISIDGNELFFYCGIVDFVDPCFEYISFPPLFEKMQQIQIPVFFTLNHLLVYALVPHIENTTVLLGPIRFNGSIPIEQNQDIFINSDWVQNVYICPFNEFIEEILLLYNLYASKIISKEILLEENLAQKHFYQTTQENYVKLVFDNLEQNIKHNPYAQEVREQQSIRNGDIEQLEKSVQEDYIGKVGILAKEPLRNYKNLFIVLTTLASRSAMQAGLSPELSYSLSDSYIQQVEEMNDISTILLFCRQMEYQYTSLVHEIKEQKKNAKKDQINPQIERCKEYIFSNLHEKMTVEKIANAIGYNPDYISHIFKQYEGIELSQYIMREKINRVKNLLMYSDYSYIKIASYLGFSSQSHLGTQFKKYTGYTLRQFREQFKRRE